MGGATAPFFLQWEERVAWRGARGRAGGRAWGWWWQLLLLLPVHVVVVPALHGCLLAGDVHAILVLLLMLLVVLLLQRHELLPVSLDERVVVGVVVVQDLEREVLRSEHDGTVVSWHAGDGKIGDGVGTGG